MGEELRNYTRWKINNYGQMVADILCCDLTIMADPRTGKVTLGEDPISPDVARLIGVRLIEAAALADGHRAIRGTPAGN